MEITKTIEIDMGHRVPNHKSKCRNLHGHRYKITACVDDKVITTKGASDEGMVIDFGDLKAIMMEVLDGGFDHGFCMFIEDDYNCAFREFKAEGQKIIFVDFVPTAENLAEYWFGLLDEKLKEKKIKLKSVLVHETPTSTAKYQVEE